MSFPTHFFAGALLFWQCVHAETAPELHEFFQEEVQQFSVRSVAPLRISNRRGKIEIRGWAQERIRANIRKIAETPEQADADRLFKSVKASYSDKSSSQMDLRIEYGYGLALPEKNLERKTPQIRADIVINAPAHLPIVISGAEGVIQVEDWRAPVQVIAQGGFVNIKKVHADSVEVQCKDCVFNLESIEAKVRAIGGTQAIRLTQVQGREIYAESQSGSIQLEGVDGKQSYLTRSGSLTGRNLKGGVDFQSQEGAVDLVGDQLAFTGATGSGAIKLAIQRALADDSLAQSESGDIQLKVPKDFKSNIDAWSNEQRPRVNLPFVASPSKNKNRILGKLGDGGALLELHSRSGKIEVTESNQ